MEDNFKIFEKTKVIVQFNKFRGYTSTRYGFKSNRLLVGITPFHEIVALVPPSLRYSYIIEEKQILRKLLKKYPSLYPKSIPLEFQINNKVNGLLNLPRGLRLYKFSYIQVMNFFSTKCQ